MSVGYDDAVIMVSDLEISSSLTALTVHWHYQVLQVFTGSQVLDGSNMGAFIITHTIWGTVRTWLSGGVHGFMQGYLDVKGLELLNP